MAWPNPFTRERTVEVGPVTSYVAEVEGDGPPLLFLHGNPDTHAVWATTIGALDSDFHSIAPDLPGFGQSIAPPDHDLSLEAQGEHIHGLVRALGLDRFHLVVHDIGGNYGLAFAAQHPQRVLSLTILNTIWSPDYRWHFWGRVWRTRGLGELAMKLSNRPLFISQLKRGSKAIPREYAEAAYPDFARSQRHVLRYYRAMNPSVYRGWDERLLAAKLPTQVIWGDADPFIAARFAEGFGVAARHTQHGHWIMAEDPELVAAAIGAFVTTSSRA